jgi:hypothetical protein
VSMTAPLPDGAPVLPETLTEEHHEALRRSWELPAYEKSPAPTPDRSHRTLVVGLLSGALGLAIGAGVGYWAQSGRIDELVARPPIVVTSTVPTVPGYSATHDSRIVEPPQSLGFGRWTRPVTVRTINPP